MLVIFTTSPAQSYKKLVCRGVGIDSGGIDRVDSFSLQALLGWLESIYLNQDDCQFHHERVPLCDQ